MSKHYAEAFSVSGGYQGRVYKYDATGEKEQVVVVIRDTKATKEEAIDSAVEWCDEHDLECECVF